MKNDAPTGTARDAAYRLLARRSHSSVELHRKLSRKGFCPDEIAQVLAECSAKGYLNDEETALRWAQNLVRTKLWGRLKISAYLAHKGIPRHVIEQVQQCIWQEFSEEAVAQQALQKRCVGAQKKLSPSQKAAFLAARGFSSSVIYTLVDRLCDDEQ
jgi:regulatory protein